MIVLLLEGGLINLEVKFGEPEMAVAHNRWTSFAMMSLSPYYFDVRFVLVSDFVITNLYWLEFLLVISRGYFF